MEKPGAVGVIAIDRARDPQIGGKGIIFLGPGKILANRGISACWNAGSCAGANRRPIDRTARVVNNMSAGVLVTGRIRLNHIPVEDREHLVEAGESIQVGAVEVGVAAIAVADVSGHEGEPRLIVLRNAVAIQSKNVRV